MTVPKRDRRSERTHEALLVAFRDLVTERHRYDQIKVGDIIERANVGRSTFYEHYQNKDEILAESIRRPFGALADAVNVGFDVAHLRTVLNHFWDNRSHARSVFGGAARRPVAKILAAMILERLAARAARPDAATRASARIAAIALADAELGPITAWLTGELGCDVDAMAGVLFRVAQASAAALYPDG
jgi:AcrR family transcriptional regulator